MSSVAPTLTDIASFGALYRAAYAARRGKHLSRASAVFFVDLETHLFDLERELLAGRWRPGPFKSFVVVDPKPRLISAAPFADRVVHHAICAALGDRLDGAQSEASYACRLGRGTTAALARVREVLAARPTAWFLKLDVRRYFETIDHEILLAALAPHVVDPGLDGLLRRIIDAGAPGSPSGKGVPIGNLTSQYFANLYLAAFDHAVIAASPGVAYVRYMDDMLFVGPDRAEVRRLAGHAAQSLGALRLELKHEVTRLGPVGSGVPFLGFRIWPSIIRLDAARRRRLGRRLRAIERELAGTGDEARAASRCASLLGWARLGEADGLVKAMRERTNRGTR